MNLPISEPRFAAFNYSASACVVAQNNKMCDNWFFNNSIGITCRKMVCGEIHELVLSVPGTHIGEMPFVFRQQISNLFIRGCQFDVIKNMIDNGYYVLYDGVDDYYLEGKPGYGTYHYSHDGMITGYDEEDKSFYISAYSKNNKYENFKVSSRSLSEGMEYMLNLGEEGLLYACKPMPYIIDLDLCRIKRELERYLDLSYTSDETCVQGLAIYSFLELYFDETNHIDIRQMRLFWEHKKCMLDRLLAIEETLKLSNDYSEEYKEVPDTSRKVMLLCEKFNMTSDRSIIPRIIENINKLKCSEYSVINKLIKAI